MSATASIRYATSAEDNVAYGEHWAGGSSVARRTMWTSLVWTSAMTAMFFLLLHAWFGSSLYLVGGVIALAWVIASFPASYRKQLRRQSLGFAGEGTEICLGKEHRLEATPAGLHAVCVAADATLAWPAIQSIVVTQTHAFLTLGPARAYVIPRQRLIEGDFDAFIAQVRQLHHPSAAGAARAP